MPIFDHFDFLAPFYDLFISPAAPDVLRQLAGLPVTGALLDAGGGTGRISHALHGDALPLVVADISLQMLRQAQAKAVPMRIGSFMTGSFA